MLTSYVVRCPHSNCRWFGSLLPAAKVAAWHGTIATKPEVMFRCPQCQAEWRARVVGDDVKPLPLERALA